MSSEVIKGERVISLHAGDGVKLEEARKLFETVLELTQPVGVRAHILRILTETQTGNVTLRIRLSQEKKADDNGADDKSAAILFNAIWDREREAITKKEE